MMVNFVLSRFPVDIQHCVVAYTSNTDDVNGQMYFADDFKLLETNIDIGDNKLLQYTFS